MSTTHCVPIASQYNRTCLGNHLPYKLTTPIPLDDDVIFYDLEFWTALQSIPSCWDKLQACPLLFSIIQSMDTSGNHHHHNNKRGINNIDFAGDDSSSSSNNRRWRSSSDKTNDNNNNNNDGRVGHSLDNKRSYSYPKFFDCSLYTPGCRQVSTICCSTLCLHSCSFDDDKC
ncbi:unnamed protein product [Trichobilharzia regenti]|nr:unnamed protein product [Trichobilharzia regenti]